MEIAQTNLQLYNQLADTGYSARAIQSVDKAYRCAAILFTGQYRSTGKTFLAHLVGTASILLIDNAPLHVVLSGLLHATFLHGEFGNGKRGVSLKRRKEVLKFVSPQVNDLIEEYTRLPWKPDYLTENLWIVDKSSVLQREVYWIRAANVLEDHIHFSAYYSQKFCKYNSNKKPHLEFVAELAEAINRFDLAQIIRIEQQKVPPSFIQELQQTQTSSYTIAPKTHIINPYIHFYAHFSRAIKKAWIKINSIFCQFSSNKLGETNDSSVSPKT